MKHFLIGVVSVCLACSWFPVNVQGAEASLTQTFQRGNTYIRYHLTPEALASQNDREATFTLTSRTIDTIDAYFECIPDTLPNGSTSGPQRFEALWKRVVPEPRYYVLPSASTASTTSAPLLASWNIGNLAIGLGYDAFSVGPGLAEQSSVQPGVQAVAGQLSFPLGDTGFSLGASVTMHAAKTQRQTYSDELLRTVPSTPLSLQAEMPVTLGYATTDGSAAESGMPVSPDTAHSPVSVLANRNTVAGAVNVSGAVKGVTVFTEVGFASGTEEYEGVVSVHDVSTSNFYAAGGANCTVGQVTLGFEAGFENGEEFVENGDSLGFEHDFFVENLLPETAVPSSSDRVYASVSAKLSPKERMMVEGAFKYIHPLKNSVEAYGFEVDGAFYYSLTNYLKYLAKAGISTLYDSLDDYQYRFTNSLQWTF